MKCIETMSHLAELVLEPLSSASQEWSVLVGEGKTKRLYGSALSKLIIYPGDWHNS